ncbi:MAG: amino acid adenylation domain-containing protein [Halioglobus sp.]|nr:amino acid adenylation domain-containing protein [Halioglobus sp.]
MSSWFDFRRNIAIPAQPGPGLKVRRREGAAGALIPAADGAGWLDRFFVEVEGRVSGTPLGNLLSAAARANADHVAVVDSGYGRVNYRDLYQLASDIATALVSVGVLKNDRVGICLPKSIGSVAAIFACLQADACYVPVDPLAPPRRSAFIFADCSVKAILVDQPLMDALVAQLDDKAVHAKEAIPIATPASAGVDLQLLLIDAGNHCEFNSYAANLAYILYTSGSTGTPKGVVHSHDTAMGFVNWASQELQLQQRDRFSSHAPFHFDLSVFDLYLSIKHQATLILIGEEQGKNPLALASLIAEQKISVWYSTPSILRLLVKHGKLENLDYSALRLVLYAGEVFPLKHLQTLSDLWPQSEYYNLYGPTETNVCTFFKLTTPIPNEPSLPQRIGVVCSGNTASVVDEDGNCVGEGVEGELWIAGESVHLGYWNLPEKNAESFCKDGKGNYWYKTGDLVVDQGGGDYLFLGRRDRMVKRRGFRIELGEIESVLYQHADIVEAAVVALPDEDSGVALHAFIQWSGDTPPSILKMKQFASENMLIYMVPDRFAFLRSLPKTSTDKVDYKKLEEL